MKNETSKNTETTVNQSPEKQVILAIDFDGTLVTSEFPEIGRDIGALFWLSQLKMLGCELILWTCRTGEGLDAAKEWLTANGYDDVITLHNEHSASNVWPIESRKIFAHFYVGDRAFGAPLVEYTNAPPHYNWELAGPMLLRQVAHQKMLWLRNGVSKGDGGK